MNLVRNIILMTLLTLPAFHTLAGGVYQKPQEFIAEIFGEQVTASVLWPDESLQEEIKNILGHKYKGLRIRYWKKEKRTAWVLEEIGKEKPITTGIVINNNRIEKVKILIFRESRGWEVRHSFFTQQFHQAELTVSNELNKTIDNISGATLSVRAVKKLARIALLLHKKVTINDPA